MRKHHKLPKINTIPYFSLTMPNKIILIILLFIGGIQAVAVAQSKTYRFHQLPQQTGFSQHTINTILQDQKGFLWLGTWLGLMRYDGYAVKVFKQETNDANGLRSNKITVVYQDKKGRIWIGTRRSGIYLLDERLDKFINFAHDKRDANSLSNDIVYSILEDNKGRFWIGTENGLNLYEPEKEQFTHFFYDTKDVSTISSNFVGSIQQGEDGSIWIGTRLGLNRLIEKGGKFAFERYYFNESGSRLLRGSEVSFAELMKEPLLSENFIYKIKPATFQKNTLWIGSKGGLRKVMYHPKNLNDIHLKTYKKDNSSSSLSYNFVRDILEHEGQLWIATLNGLNLLDLRTEKVQIFKSNPDDDFSLSNNTVISLYKDLTNILWIGTEKGLNKLELDSKPFQSITFSKNTNIITAIAKGNSDNTVWLGTRGGGINRLAFDGSSINTHQFDFPKTGMMQLSGFVTGIVADNADNADNLWFSTNGAGLIKVDTRKLPNTSGQITNYRQFVEKTEKNSIADNYVMCIQSYNHRNIWIGLWDKGINRLDPKTETFFHYTQIANSTLNLENFPVVTILETKQNDQNLLWVGTRGNGVYLLKYLPEQDQLELIKHFLSHGQYPISNNFINQIHQDAQGTIWVATENGLNKLTDNQVFEVFTEKDGLSNSIIQSIQSDQNGNLWCSTKDGLNFLDLSSSSEVVIKAFDAYYNLDFYQYNNSALRLQNGNLLFGGLNGVTLFNPTKIEDDSIAPKVSLVDFRLFNESLQIGERVHNRVVLPENINSLSKITLQHTENNFTFQFAALHFAYPEKNKFRYKLEGYDKDWIYTDAKQRVASYTNLPYRSYEFKVQAANYDGIWSQETKTIKVVVKPPFWLTGWAMFLYSLLFVGIMLFLRQLTVIRTNLKNKIELERVKREKLEEVNDLKIQFFTNISHELRTPLTLIVSPLEELIRNSLDNKKRHRTYLRMHKNANRLLNMINQLLDIRKSEAGLLQLQVSEQDFVQFVNEAALSFKGLAHAKHIELVFEHTEEELKVWFDTLQMEKVIFNLFSNALKFTPEGGKITAKVYQSNNENAIFSISDTGVGIPKGDLKQVFERFYQVEDQARTSQGSGIGLALSKNIVEAHHGTIEVQSEFGNGSTFYVYLKKGKQHFSKKEISTHTQQEQQIFSKQLTTDTTEPEPESTTIQQQDNEKNTLLLVEDNPDIRAYLKDHFQDQYNIEEAENGKIALEKAKKNPPSLIISDIAMPEMDGIEFCNEIKKDMVTSHIPVVLLTARTSLFYKMNGLETGADDYITKPFNMTLLMKRVENIIENRKRLQEKFASNNFDFKPTEVVVNSIDEEFLLKVRATIEKNIDNSGFSVEALAKELLMSSIQLYRKTKALTGKTPVQVIRSMRLQRAAQLLKTGNYTVTEVTYMVGFQDLKYFRQRFKKEFGVNPSAYK